VATISAPPSVPARTLARPRPGGRELEPLSAVRFGVHFTADAELRELIERARALASHRIPNGDLAGLMKLVVARFVEQEEKRRFGIGTRPHRARSEAKPENSAEGAAPPGGGSLLDPARRTLRTCACCARLITSYTRGTASGPYTWRQRSPLGVAPNPVLDLDVDPARHGRRDSRT